MNTPSFFPYIIFMYFLPLSMPVDLTTFQLFLAPIDSSAKRKRLRKLPWGTTP